MNHHNLRCPVPVVRALIEDSKGRVLLLRRSNTEHGLGAWCLPGGKVDYGQTVEDALRREVLEETSLRISSMEFWFLQDSLPSLAGDMHCINLYFRCRASGDIRLNDESGEYAWVGPGETGAYRIVFRNEEALRRHFESGIR